MKVNTLRRQAWEALKAAGIADPVREADWLLAPALGLSLPKLLFEGDRSVTPLQAEQAWTSAGDAPPASRCNTYWPRRSSAAWSWR